MSIVLGYTPMRDHIMIIYKWEIDNISSYIEKQESNADYNLDLESVKFSPRCDSDIKWYLKLKSQNQDHDKQTWLSLLLCYSPAKEFRVSTQCLIFILSDQIKKVNVVKSRNLFNKDGDNWTCAEFVKIADLKEKKCELCPNDTLKIEMMLDVYDCSMPYDHIERPTILMPPDYKKSVESKGSCDVVFKVKDEIFKAHKKILMANSKRFFNMFTAKMKGNKEELITLTDIEPEIFNGLLEFIYTEHVIDINFLAKNLLIAADKYLINSLKDFCSKSLLEQVNVMNAIEYLELAKTYHADGLVDKIAHFIGLNFGEIYKTPNFQAISKSRSSLRVTVLMKILEMIGNGEIVPKEDHIK